MGPFTHPFALRRALEHTLWPQATEAVPQHASFVRLRVSYAFSESKDIKALPENYDPIAELSFITEMAGLFLSHPSAVCLFDPNGETLLTFSMMNKMISTSNAQGKIPIQLWTNDRYFVTPEGWAIVDCVGNAQFDLMDHEMVFEAKQFAAFEIAQAVRKLTWYQLERTAVVQGGDTISGPNGSTWIAHHAQSIMEPKREVLRWFMTGVEEVPEALATNLAVDSAPAPISISQSQVNSQNQSQPVSRDAPQVKRMPPPLPVPSGGGQR